MHNRREFIKKSAAFSAIMAMSSSFAIGQGTKRVFKVGMIGSGRRASAAFENLKEAAKSLNVEIKLVATHDLFLDVAQNAAKKYGCDEKYAFGGAAGYKKLLETDCESVIMAAPPAFRPLHLEAAIKAGKHAFAEKPVAVDPPGIRKVLAAAAEAKVKKLALVAGTQRRHQGTYLCQALALQKGQLGKILGGAIYWCQARGSVRPRRPTDTNAGYMANNWMNWAEMSGDHIVEQHVHNIDIANWFIGHPPRMAIGVGARLRRPTGNQYDFFSVDLDYGDGLHIHSLSRQIPGCYARVGENFITDAAEIMGGGKIRRFDGKEVEYEPVGHEGNPYVNEHADMLKSILDGNVLNEGENVAMSTATAIIGRISAYTGQAVRMSDILITTESPFYNLAFKPSPLDFEGEKDIELPKENTAPIPGKD
ncbi:MAG: Gfo/Idh/MocA family oxidoreductase [Kiritimatiellae bacterium]|nr:Gfo/Idh/MocA family oxidoreductase [Kiritimatiellia bacterium]MDD5519668.1 Gfo/Idh/MocA family oxidoreductase [Kiritimatiellia bacterium]